MEQETVIRPKAFQDLFNDRGEGRRPLRCLAIAELRRDKVLSADARCHPCPRPGATHVPASHSPRTRGTRRIHVE